MSISNISTEQAFDMLPHVSDIYTNLNIKDYLQNNATKAKTSNKEEITVLKNLAGADLIAYILKNSPKAKDSFFNIVAIVDGKSVEEVKKQSLLQTMSSVKAIMNDSELLGFFTQSV